MLNCPVMSDSANPWTIAYQSLLSMGIPQARILEWIAIPFSRGPSPCRDQTPVSCTAGRFLTIRTTREALYPLNTFPSTPDPGNPSSVLCLYTFDYDSSDKLNHVALAFLLLAYFM